MSWSILAVMNFQGSDLPSAVGLREKIKTPVMEIKLCLTEGIESFIFK